MKKLIAITLTLLLLILTLVVPASAATTTNWDWGKARGSIDKAITEIVQEQQTKPTETADIPETEYVVVEETLAATEKSTVTEPVIQPVQEKMQSWRDWLRRWSWCVEGWK